MSVLSQFIGGERIASLVGTPANLTALQASASTAGASTALSGAMSAGVLKTALSVSGRGRINWAAVYTNDVTSRTLRMVITIDGAVVRDHTTAAISTINTGFVGIGGGTASTTPVAVFQPLRFTSSLLIEIASSVTETDKATFASIYEVFV